MATSLYINDFIVAFYSTNEIGVATSLEHCHSYKANRGSKGALGVWLE